MLCPGMVYVCCVLCAVQSENDSVTPPHNYNDVILPTVLT
jgi:hypothetical protein